MQHFRVIALVLAALMAAGCASTSDLKTPIHGFNVATDEASKTLAKYDETLAEARRDSEMQLATSGQGAVVQHADGECGVDSKRCLLFVKTADGQKYPLAGQQAIAARIMAGIAIYAGDLEAIATMDTQSGVETSFNAAIANLTEAAKDADEISKALGRTSDMAGTVGKYAGPLSDTAQFFLNYYLERKKIAALQRATQAMNAILPDLVSIVSLEADAGADVQRADLLQAVTVATTAYGGDPRSRAKLEALDRAAMQYDAFLNVHRADPFESLKKAHAELTATLKDGKMDFKSVLATLGRAIADLKRAQAIIDEYKTAFAPAKS